MWDDLHARIDAESSEARKALVDQINSLTEQLREIDAQRQKRHQALDFALGKNPELVLADPPYVNLPVTPPSTADGNGTLGVFPAARATRAFIKKKLKKGDVFDQRNVYNYLLRIYPKEVKSRKAEILRSQISRALANMGELEMVEEGKGGKPNQYKKR